MLSTIISTHFTDVVRTVNYNYFSWIVPPRIILIHLFYKSSYLGSCKLDVYNISYVTFGKPFLLIWIKTTIMSVYTFYYCCYARYSTSWICHELVTNEIELKVWFLASNAASIAFFGDSPMTASDGVSTRSTGQQWEDDERIHLEHHFNSFLLTMIC